MIGKKTEKELKRIPCVLYSITLKDQTKVLLDSESKINAMSQTFAYKLDLKIWKTNVGTLKIDDTTLETYGIVVSTFLILDKDSRERFYEESFLLPNVKSDVVLRILFLAMNNADVDFQARDLQ